MMKEPMDDRVLQAYWGIANNVTGNAVIQVARQDLKALVDEIMRLREEG